MKTLVLRVIAEPAQIFWAPVALAGGNVLINICAMLFGIMLFDFNPLPFFVTTIVGHGLIAGWAARDPHLTTLLAAWMVSRRKTVNLLATKGNKYVP
jgi:hypothetical protein